MGECVKEAEVVKGFFLKHLNKGDTEKTIFDLELSVSTSWLCHVKKCTKIVKNIYNFILYVSIRGEKFDKQDSYKDFFKVFFQSNGVILGLIYEVFCSITWTATS